MINYSWTCLPGHCEQSDLIFHLVAFQHDGRYSRQYCLFQLFLLFTTQICAATLEPFAGFQCLFSCEIPEIHHWHVPMHPSSLGQGNWCQSAVCGSCRRSINHWLPSLGKSIFTSNCPSSYGYLKLKWTLGGINIIWKGERDFWPLTLGCGSAGGGWGGGWGYELSFPCLGLGMSHDEPCADSLWWVIDPPLGSPSGRCLLASLARAY